MTEYLTVNRELADKAMNRIDHALGRPLDPLAETYRNHYALHADSPGVDEFRASPHWDCPGEFIGMVYFRVNAAGRRALAAHLKQIADPHRSFIVTFQGYPGSVVAKTRSEAKYKRYLGIADVWSELTFKEFCKTATVRRAAA
jgi:hypothetical protein